MTNKMQTLLFLECSICFEWYYRSSSGTSKLYLQLLVLFPCVVVGCCHGWVWTTQPWQQQTTIHGNKTRSFKYSLDAADDER